MAAEAGVASAEAALRDAEYEARRTEELRRGGTGAVRDAVRAGLHHRQGPRASSPMPARPSRRCGPTRLAAAASARTARAQVEAARATEAQRAAQLRQVEVDLGFATIRSPIDGVVVSRNVDLGQTVAASFQAPVLFSIAANLEEMEIWATVDEADIGRIRPGQEVPFTVASYPGETLSGRVKEIRLAAQTVSNVVTYTVVVTVPNARRAAAARHDRDRCASSPSTGRRCCGCRTRRCAGARAAAAASAGGAEARGGASAAVAAGRAGAAA